MLSTTMATGRLFEGLVLLVLSPVRGFMYAPVSGGVIGLVVTGGLTVVVVVVVVGAVV